MRGRRGVRRHGGFTLVEVALVLVVLGVLLRAVVVPLGDRLERRRHDETLALLDEVRRALVGHLVTRGVLPCPLEANARAGGAGDIDPSGLGDDFGGGYGAAGSAEVACARADGFVPAVTLGVSGAVDAHGALLDPWGRPLRYGVSLASSAARGVPSRPDWTSPGEARAVGLDALEADLVLCRTEASGTCPRSERRAGALAFVVLSSGRDGSPAGAQRENLDGDGVYALATPSVLAERPFDDALVWASRNELAYWLLRAGWLP